MDSGEYRSWIADHLKIGQEFLYLSLEDCKSTGVTEDDIFDLTERALVAHGRKEVEMPAYVPSELACGIKWGANFPTSAERLPEPVPTNCLLIYNDHQSGLPLALMDAYWITEVRTPSVAFVAAKHLANLTARSFGMIGCGIQGKAHVKMAGKVLPGLEEIHAETGEVAAGLRPGRTSPDEMIVVNNVGMAVEGMVVARRLFDTAIEKGIGVKLPLWDRTS
jgi:ornithine cyclodeaminase/alanine dehydrogenase